MNLRSFLTLIALLAGLGVSLALALFPPPRESLLRSPAGNQAHAIEFLPQAPMIQAADSCGDGHFEMLEQYGLVVHDFQMLLDGPSPDSAARELAAGSSAVGRFFGLAALAVLDSAAAVVVVHDTYLPDSGVTVAEGCRTTERSLRQLRIEVESGYWPRELTKRRVAVH